MNNNQSDNTDSAFIFVLPWGPDSAGGVNQVVTNLIRQFDIHEEYVPLLLINSWTHTSITEKYCDNHRYLYFRMRSPWDVDRPIKNLLAFILELPLILRKLHAILVKENVKGINAHYPGLFLYQFILLKFFGLFDGKIILSFHGSDIRNASKTKGIEKALWLILLKLADAVVVCSENLKQEVMAFRPGYPDKIYAIHNGLDIDFLLKERDNDFHLDPILQKQPFILNIATFEQKKGQDVLIKAFASIAARFPQLNLALVGRPAEALDELKGLIASLQLQNRVFLYEGVTHDKISAFLEKATMFCLPSRIEPFGIVVLEAGVFSIPVVASRVGGIPEIVSHNETGRLFEPEDVDALADEIVMLLENPNERKRLGTNLRAHVLANFTWQSAYQKYMQLL